LVTTLTTGRIHKWAKVGSVPVLFHLALIRAAEARGFDISADMLARLHAASDEGAA